MKKYRIKEWKDAPARVIHTWMVQKRKFLIFWESIELFRTYQEAEQWIERKEIKEWIIRNI